MSEFVISYKFKTRESLYLLEQQANLQKALLEEAVKICGFKLRVESIELIEHYASHGYPVGYRVRVVCENETQYTAIKLVL